MHVAHLRIHVHTDRNPGPLILLCSVVLSRKEPEPAKFNRTVGHAVKAVNLVLVMFTRATNAHRDIECTVCRLGNTSLSFSTREDVLA